MTIVSAGARPRHHLSGDDYRALAAGRGDDDTIRQLRSAERSWRMVVLSLLLNRLAGAAEDTGGLIPADEAWQLFAAADRADPQVADDVLAQPQVGIWAAHLLRRLDEDRPTGDDPPLWIEAGYLHALAAAGAIRAGLTFEIAIPARDGIVVLPTVGSASIPPTGPWSTARIRCAGGSFEVISADGTPVGPGTPSWRPPIVVTATENGLTLSVELMDRDHYRDLRGPAAPGSLTPTEVSRWQALLSEAWSMLVREQPEHAPAIAATLRVFTPVAARERFRYLSASGGEAFGNILLSDLDDAVDLAVTLIHETQHQKLGALLHLLTLSEEDPGHRYYAPWRDDPRPLGGLLQGVYAFSGITEFWSRCGSAGHQDLAGFELSLWRGQTLGALRTLITCGGLTPRGQQFVELLLDSLQASSAKHVPEPLERLARLAALDHRALWRGHHLVVDPAVAESLADAWRRGEPAAIAADDLRVTTSASPEVGLFDTRAVLIRHHLTDPSLTRRMRQDPDLPAATVSGARPADVLLVSGDHEAAQAAYAENIAADPASVHAWVGLGLARSELPDDPAVRALLGRPELVRAVASRLAPMPDPVLLAGWLGAGIPATSVREMPVPAVWPVA